MDSEILFASLAASDAGDSSVGVVWWAQHAPGGYAATILDYTVAEIADIDANWIGDTQNRSAELAAQYRPARPGCMLRVEQAGLRQVLEGANAAYRDSAGRLLDRLLYDVRPVKDSERAKWAPAFGERAATIKQLVNSGRIIRAEPGLRRLTFRAVKANHLISEIGQFRLEKAATASGLLTAFVLGALLATTPKGSCWFSQDHTAGAAKNAEASPSSPFGTYIRGRPPR